MTLDEVLQSLFPKGHSISRSGEVLTGHAPLKDGGDISVIGIVNGKPLSPDDVVVMAAHVLDVIEAGGATPILVLVDTASQLMSRHAEMVGLNEYCAHLAKCLFLASQKGHRTVGFEYGQAAAAAFLATALATDTLVVVEGATPTVMDLPSISRVTKIPKDELEKMAKSMPVFAPGIDSLLEMGAVAAKWDAAKPLDAQLLASFAGAKPEDERDVLGRQRGGRKMAADVAARVAAASRAAA